MPHKRILLSWSSGKDSAWALHVLRESLDCEVCGLLTTVNAAFNRVAMHAVRRVLLELQAKAVDLPLTVVPLPWPCSNAIYEEAMRSALAFARDDLGITHVAFGDLFLEDVRAYREKQITDIGLTPLFPLWGEPADILAHTMIAGGLKAALTCVDPKTLPPNFAGRNFDEALLKDLPEIIDPCGERGEFHTFAFDGPMLGHKIDVTVGEVIHRDGFVFADIVPKASSESVCSAPKE